MDQEAVAPEVEVEVPSEAVAEQPQEAQEVQQEETMVPLRVVQTERRKRHHEEDKGKQKDERIKALESQLSQSADETRYESATKEDLGNSEETIIRKVEERARITQRADLEDSWERENPEKFKRVKEDLPAFLETRPNLCPAIVSSKNRYKEAWELMSALSPKQQHQAVQKPKPQAPGSPSGVPKSAAMSENVDLMNMSDSEFNDWRKQKRGQR
jgi:YesN/AraC family two-component response regulator